MDWDISIRPIIAKLYKVGVIRNNFSSRTPGQAMAVKEVDQDRDFYIDFRQTIDGIVFPRDVEQPPSIDYLLLTARKFAKINPSARFALLRLWELTSFTDALGRAWEWNFVPKDIPYLETSMHHSGRLHIIPYMHLLGERVYVRRNLYLVMGENEEDLLKYAIAATFVIQTEL